MRHAFWHKPIRRPTRRRLLLERLEDRSLLSGSPLELAVPLDFVRFGQADVAHVSHFLSSPDRVALYKVTLQPGDTIAAAVRAQPDGSALASLLRIFDANGAPLALNDQIGDDASLRFQASAGGTYHVGVSSAPNNAYDPTLADATAPGATTGLYALDVRLTSAAPLPDLIGSSFRLGRETASVGDSVPLSFLVDNRGGADPGAFRVEILLSPDNLFGTTSSVVVASLRRDQLVSRAGGRTFASPAGFSVALPAVASGKTFVGLRLIPDVPESSASNNAAVHHGTDWAPLSVTTSVPSGVTDLSQADANLNAAVNGGLAFAEADVFSFTVGDSLDNGRLSAIVRSTGGTLVPRLTLSAPDGRLLIQSDDGRIDQHLTPGAYVLAVSGRSGQGNYRLDTTFVRASIPGVPLVTGEGVCSVDVADFDNDGHLDFVTADRLDQAVSIFLGNGDGTFQPAKTFAAGPRMWRITVGDANSDGRPDLLTANKGDNTVSVLLGNGDGTFQTQRVVPAGTRVGGAVLADVDGDGTPDMIQDNYAEDTVFVLLGGGDGTFGPPDVYPTDDNGDFQGVDVAKAADVSGDGIPDLLYATYIGEKIVVRVGLGDGTFGPEQRFAALLGAYEPYAVDVNGDGLTDLVCANSVENTITVLLNQGWQGGVGSFAPARDFAVGANPYSLEMADVNGDGRTDFVTCNRDDNTVSVLLGNGDGTFQEQKVFLAGKTSRHVAVADFDGDGKVDLVTVNQGEKTASILLGNGDGTFVSDQTTAPAPAARPFQVAVADLNGDGRPDVATANRSDNSVGVLLGNADGSFTTRETFGVDRQPFSVTSADVNGDGLADLLTANYAGGSVSILLGNGDGTFQPHQDLTAGSNAYAVRVDDVNADGIPDVLCTNKNDNTIGVFLGLGGGAFTEMATYDVGNGPYELVIHDLDRDGALDVVVSHFSEVFVDVLMGNGDGTFRPTTTYPVLSRPYGLAVADVDGDGLPDVVTSNYRSADVSVLLGNGDGSLKAPLLFPVGVAPNEAQVGDVNGDGFLDAVTANYGSNDVSVLLGNGDGTFAPHHTFPAGNGPASVALADVTGDGLLDVVVGNRTDSTVQVLAGVGDGTFAAPVPFGASKARYSQALADVNGDGKLDLLAARQLQNDVTVQLGTGTGTFGPAQAVAVGMGPTSVAAADFNGDGRIDLVTTHSTSGDVGVLLGNGDGTFGAAQSFAVGRSPRAAVVADVDGDGAADVVVANYHDATVSVLLGRGDGTLVPQRAFAVGRKPYSLVVADVDGDGLPDVVVANSADDGVSVLLGNGDGTFAAQQTFATGRQPFSVALGDATGDGIADVVTADAFDDAVSVLPGTGDGTFGAARTFAVGARPYSVSLADVDGDGDADLIVTNYRDRSVSLLLNDGSGGFLHQRTPTADPLPTRTVVGDLNNDRVADLVSVTNQTRNAGVLLGRGDGTFTAASAETEVGLRDRPFLSDLDGDGTFDRVVLDRSGAVLFRKGLPGGAGGFASPVVLNPGRPAADVALVRTGTGLALAAAEGRDVSLYTISPAGAITRTTAFAATGVPARLVAADLDGDGRDDLVAANPLADSVSISTQTATGQFAPPIARPTGGTPSDVAVVDINRDGRPDVLVSDQTSGDVTVLLGDGASFAEARRFRSSTATYGLEAGSVRSIAQSVSLAAGDFTGDGLPDVVVVNRGLHGFSVLAGNGTGGFSDPTPALTTPTSDGFLVNDRPGAIATGDFDRDGDLDVALLLEDSRQLWVFATAGDGTFRRTFSAAVGDQATGLTVIPGSGPELLDLLVGNGFGDVLHLEGRGDGTFQIRGKRVSLSVIPDLFGAGQAGVLVGNQQDNRVTVQTSASGGGQFETVQTLGSEATQLAPGDVQFARLRGADALPDAIVVSTGSNAVVVYRTTGVSGGVPSFAPTTQTFFAGTSPAGAGVADVNADGVVDLVIANQGSNDVSVVFGSLVNGDWVGTPGPRLKSGGAGPIAVTARDLTGDAVADLVVTNGAAGTLTMLPGVGQGFFDDRQPATLFDLGGALAQAPTFLGGSGVGIAVTAGGSLVRFDLDDVAAGTQVVFAEQGVLAARVLESGQVVVALSGGSVKVLAEQGDTLRVAAELQAQAGVPVLPSSLEVIQSGGQFQVLVSSQGSDTIFVFNQAAAPTLPGGGGVTPPIFGGGTTPTAPTGGVSTPATGSFASGPTVAGTVATLPTTSVTGISSNVGASLAIASGGQATAGQSGTSAGAALGGTLSEGSGSAGATASLVAVQGNAYATVAVLDFGGTDEAGPRGRVRSSLATAYAIGDASPLTRFVTGHDEAVGKHQGPKDDPLAVEEAPLVDPWKEDLFHRLRPPRLMVPESEPPPPSMEEEEDPSQTQQTNELDAKDLVFASLALLAPLRPTRRRRGPAFDNPGRST